MELKSLKERGIEGLPKAFNQTKVELKSIVHNVNNVLWSLLIRPKWNWNLEWKNHLGWTDLLLIRPKWNWNCLKKRRPAWRLKLLIRPKWNWNIPRAAATRNLLSPFNQTKVELKFHTATLPSGKTQLLIRPKWNWNGSNGGQKYIYWSF